MTFRPDHLQALADTLWTQRHLLTRLLLKLTTARLLLAAEQGRFVAAALEEIEAATEALREVEVRRSLAALAVAADHRVPLEDLTLRVVAEQVPASWRGVFDDHRRTLCELSGEVAEAASTSMELLARALRRLSTTRAALIGAPHAQAGDLLQDPVEALLALQVQEITYRAVLRVAARPLPPSLAAFLR